MENEVIDSAVVAFGSGSHGDPSFRVGYENRSISLGWSSLRSAETRQAGAGLMSALIPKQKSFKIETGSDFPPSIPRSGTKRVRYWHGPYQIRALNVSLCNCIKHYTDRCSYSPPKSLETASLATQEELPGIISERISREILPFLWQMRLSYTQMALSWMSTPDYTIIICCSSTQPNRPLLSPSALMARELSLLG